MAITTAQAFNEFIDKISLTDAQWSIVSDRRSTTHDYLAASFDSTSEMPLVRTTLIGSADRGTIIRPLDDVDVLAVFSNERRAFEKYHLDSSKFLYRVREALAEYRIQTVGARGQAVRLFYRVEPNVDIAPVFAYSDGGYALPSGSGNWLRTDPDFHRTWINQRNEELNYHLKPFVKMLKRWNRIHSSYLKSFHLEVLAAKFFRSMGSNYREALKLFFDEATYQLDINDPAGCIGSLSDYLTSSRRTSVVANLQSAQELAASAMLAEARGAHEEAIRSWRIILGNEFPAYR